MIDQRDQLQAHRFVVGRLVSAVVRGRADDAPPPTQRTRSGLLIGTGITVLVLLVVGLIGFIKPGSSTSWRQDKVLVIEKETGNRYVFLAGQLHPVANGASVRLIAGGAPEVQRVSTKSLTGTPHGATVGILGAPEWLPSGDQLLASPWTVCSSTARLADGTPSSSVQVWLGPADGLSALADDEAFVVSVGEDLYLVSQGRRNKLAEKRFVTVLGYSESDVVEVDPRWLNTLEAGPDVFGIGIPGRGDPGPEVGGRRLLVGQVLRGRTTSGDEQWFLTLPGDALQVTGTEAAVHLGASDVADSYPDGPVEPVLLSPEELQQLPRSTADAFGAEWPETVPSLPATGSTPPSPCTTVPVDGDVGLGLAWRPPPGDATASGEVRVAVPPGRGALVSAQASRGVPTGTLYVVTDDGRKYPVKDRETAGHLGFGAVEPQQVPAELLDLLPTGPALDPALATELHPDLGTPVEGSGTPVEGAVP